MVLQQTIRGSLIVGLLALARVLVVSGAFAGTPKQQAPRQVPQTVVVRVNGSLRWLDVGLGVAATLAVLALVYGLVLVVRRNGSHDHERSYR